MGSSLKLKAAVVPHKNLIASIVTSKSQLTDSAKKRKRYLLNVIDKNTNSVARELFPSRSMDVAMQSVEPQEAILQSSPGKCISWPTQITPSICSVAVNTEKAQLVDRATSPCFPEDNFLKSNTEEVEIRPSTPAASDSTIVTEPLFSSYSPSSLWSTTCGTQSQVNRLVSTLMLMEIKTRFYLGLPQEVYIFVKEVSTHTNVSHRDILITLKKLGLLILMSDWQMTSI